MSYFYGTVELSITSQNFSTADPDTIFEILSLNLVILAKTKLLAFCVHVLGKRYFTDFLRKSEICVPRGKKLAFL